MVFSSAVFLFIFLPVVFLLNTVLPDIRVRNALLAVASLIFYAFGEPVYILLMLLSIFMNYIFGLLVSRQNGSKKPALVCGIVLNLLMLSVFKYSGFIIGNINALFSLSLTQPEIRLPIGISFFTFQAMSYVIDVYRDPSLCQKNFGRLMLYVSFFPQLIAGPIIKYGDIAQELNDRSVSLEDAAQGLRRFVIGLSKKLLIANTLGYASDTIFAQNGISLLPAWAGAVFYMMQIYYDFSGYSDMAIGLGRAFGFHFKENFNYPYSAIGIKDFWRRWHISLSGWFREYLYIPLGGNRRGKARTVLNKYIVFFLTDLWHGASWNFVLWGLIHGTLLVLEDATVLSRLREKPVLGRVYTLLAVMLSFVLFRADTLSDGFAYLRSMFYVPSISGIILLLPLVIAWIISIILVIVILVFMGKRVRAGKFNLPLAFLGAFVLLIVLYALFHGYELAGGFVYLVSGIFFAYSTTGLTSFLPLLTPWLIFIAVIGIIFAFPIKNTLAKTQDSSLVRSGSYVLSLALYVLCILNLASSTFNPFIYFRF